MDIPGEQNDFRELQSYVSEAIHLCSRHPPRKFYSSPNPVRVEKNKPIADAKQQERDP